MHEHSDRPMRQFLGFRDNFVYESVECERVALLPIENSDPDQVDLVHKSNLGRQWKLIAFLSFFIACSIAGISLQKFVGRKQPENQAALQEVVVTGGKGLISAPTSSPTSTRSITVTNRPLAKLSGDSWGSPTQYPTAGIPTHFPTNFSPTLAPLSTQNPTDQSQWPSPSSTFVEHDPSAPTMYPTAIQDPKSPTLYPTNSAPTMYPNGPTQYPTAGVPTMYPSAPIPTAEPTEATPTVAELEIVFKRDGYSKVELHGNLMFYEFLKKYDAVIEPYATMVPVIVDLTSDERYYSFEICLEDEVAEGMFTQCASGNMTTDSIPMFEIECKPYDELSVTFVEYQSSNNEVLREASGYAVCMYVRREIRDLTSADLNSTMDAMHAMWEYSEEEGQKLYGDKFHSNEYFVGFHYFNAAWQDADHIHEGNGFLPQHIKITNMFEESMQAVDPSVTIPYWDFTIDSAYDVAISESYIMTPEVFGSMKLPKDPAFGFTFANDSILDGAIPDGRWAYTPANMNTQFDDFNQGYGYLRAPWNQNPNPYLSRYVSYMDISLPDCGSHYTALQQTDLVTFTETIEAGPHAKTHVKIGGIFGCDLLYPMFTNGLIKDLTTFQDMCGNWAFSLKEFYRDNFLIPNTNCTVDSEYINNSTCGYVCNDPDDLFIADIMSKFAASVPENMTRMDWETWKEFICDGDGQRIIFGEHLESSSTSDPSFWPIHPTLERLLQAKLMAGGFSTSEWPTDPINQYVCDKSSCYSPTYGSFDNFTDCCVGHYEYSRLFDAASGNRSQYVGLTNGEVIAYTDPSSTGYNMPYIYADFTWPHCYETDHLTNFDALLVSLSETYTRHPSSYPTSVPSVSMEPTAPTPLPTEEPSPPPTIKPTPTSGPTPQRPTELPTTTPAPTPGKPTAPPTNTSPPTPVSLAPTPGKPTEPPTPSFVKTFMPTSRTIAPTIQPTSPTYLPTIHPTPGSPAPSTGGHPTQSTPTQSTPTQSTPTQSTPTQSTPTQTTPTESTPTSQSTPTQSIPTQSAPTAQSVPTTMSSKAVSHNDESFSPTAHPTPGSPKPTTPSDVMATSRFGVHASVSLSENMGSSNTEEEVEEEDTTFDFAPTPDPSSHIAKNSGMK